jgi:8-oxo-dGTP pyrophosphatase MutT (NUDIX family)
MRERNVVVAIVQAGPGRFLIVFNHNWGGFSFPMTVLPDGENPIRDHAVQALVHDLGFPLPHATAELFARVRLVGPSQSTGEDTLYQFFLFEVNPGQPLDLAAAPAHRRAQFFDQADRHTRRDLTWTFPDLLREFVDAQEVALAVVTRPGADGPEFLLVHNERFGGYFFPVRRIRSDAGAEPTAVGAVRTDTGYTGPAVPTYLGEALAVQHSPRFDLERQYRFHVCAVALPHVDLSRHQNGLERALSGRQSVWLSADGLRNPPAGVTLSPTMPLVRVAVTGLTPPTGPLRTSEGGLAAIVRKVADRREWLVIWNGRWGAFFLVGGHRLPHETFRECVVREVGEELAGPFGMAASEYMVATTPTHQHRFRAVSGSTNQWTDYTLEVFAVTLTPAALGRLADPPAGAPRIAWVTDAEIHALETSGGQPISPTVEIVL